jgi:predicted kinase
LAGSDSEENVTTSAPSQPVYNRQVPTVHIICGPLGAGKTTLARRIAKSHHALRFSLDEWVMQLFGSEAPQPMVFEWWDDHCKRCSTRIWSVAKQALALGVDVVLDCGFPALAQRNEYRTLALQAGAAVHLHIVDADRALRADRVRSRNRERGETFALFVTDDMFEGSESWWEPPAGPELTGAFTYHEGARTQS